MAGPRPLLVAYNGDRFDVAFMLYKNSALDPAAFPVFEAIYTSDPMVCAQKTFERAQLGGSFRQASMYAFLFGAEPPREEQLTSRGDVAALSRIVQHARLRDVVAASARPLRDNTGQHMAAALRFII